MFFLLSITLESVNRVLKGISWEVVGGRLTRTSTERPGDLWHDPEPIKDSSRFNIAMS
jgi:hypothetical protein